MDDQGACWGRCSNSIAAMDVCGDYTSNTVIYYDISEYFNSGNLTSQNSSNELHC